jgi:hypothetical protein
MRRPRRASAFRVARPACRPRRRGRQPRRAGATRETPARIGPGRGRRDRKAAPSRSAILRLCRPHVGVEVRETPRVGLAGPARQMSFRSRRTVGRLTRWRPRRSAERDAGGSCGSRTSGRWAAGRWITGSGEVHVLLHVTSAILVGVEPPVGRDRSRCIAQRREHVLRAVHEHGGGLVEGVRFDN